MADSQNTSEIKRQFNLWKIFALLSAVSLILVLAVNLNPSLKGFASKNYKLLFTSKNTSFLIEPVLADNIYPMFFCPCCGQPLDKNNICCEQAQERIDYIDSLTAQNISEKEIILAYVKKYGLNSFVDKVKQQEFKEELAKTAPAERPIISFSPETYNFGDVSQKGGVVTTFFELKNKGEKDLVIDRMDSSCGCTSASIVFRGVEGPRFAMVGHGTVNPTDWQVIIPPEETAQLKVYYDPDVHKDFRGFAIREIYIYSNDSIDFEKKVSVELNQVD